MPRKQGQLAFADARLYARELGLRTKRDWEAWARPNSQQLNIPVRPDCAYADDGWMGWPDFLHEGPTTPRFRSFGDARLYARELGLRTKRDWEAWAATGARPADIPISPDSAYAGDGWMGWPDFLGPIQTPPRSPAVLRCSALRLMRARRRLRLSDVAQAVSLSAAYLSELERGAKQPSPATLAKLADYYNTKPLDIRVAMETETTPPDPRVRVKRVNSARAPRPPL